MNLLKGSDEKLADEKYIQNKIYQAIDDNNNFVFDAGAGAGKTYALIESLKYIVNLYGEKLSNKNQNVLCITYTNAAVDNIKSNFGNSDVVRVSTIHDRIWGVICLHQDALVIEHKSKIRYELETIENDFSAGKAVCWLNGVSAANKEKFEKYFLDPEVKDSFYRSTDHALDFKGMLEECGYNLNKNLGKFRDSVKYTYNTHRLNRCLELIELGEYKEVKYNANFNSDRLHYMIISHDTLLEYALALCEKYPMLRRIIIDSYPYILIDEYQDTSCNVVRIMNELTKECEGSKQFLVGYFGDKMQSIYTDGVSSSLNDNHVGLLRIEKKYNRRSRNEILNVSNKLRNDGLLQESIYDNNVGGSFSFHQLVSPRPSDSSALVNEFIKRELTILNEDDVHCLVLKNEMLAELSGFKELFIGLKGFFFYKEQAQKIISRDLNKLDAVVRVIYGLIGFHELVSRKYKTLEEILPKEKMAISMFESQSYVTELDVLVSEKVNTFENYLSEIFSLYENGSEIFKIKINELLPSNEFGYTLKGFYQFLNSELPASKAIPEDKRLEIIDQAMNIDLADYINWYEFISGTSSSLTTFHTYHSTKGLEYKNVVIIMENSFGGSKSYFPDFFNKPSEPGFEERRNLLYVACSRAIINMRVLYLDSIEDFKDEISLFFGKVQDFSIMNSEVKSGLLPKCTAEDLTPKRFCELEHLKSMWSSKIRRKQELIVPASRLKGESELLSGEDWFFNVHFAFRSALDINYVERKKDKKFYMVWMQGPILKFKEGDMLHSRDGTIILQVKNANPMGWDSSLDSMYEGTILFEVYKNIDNKISKVKSYTCTQMSLLEILITGEFDESKISIH
jgi:DNA helicase-2/ATP-dependent DNA helicase PcrA